MARVHCHRSVVQCQPMAFRLDRLPWLSEVLLIEPPPFPFDACGASAVSIGTDGLCRPPLTESDPLVSTSCIAEDLGDLTAEEQADDDPELAAAIRLSLMPPEAAGVSIDSAAAAVPSAEPGAQGLSLIHI